MAQDYSGEVRWLEWSDEVFERAEREDKLILLDISASWCHWCHVMDRATYSDPDVIGMLNERFVPVRVDADKRPDIQERYLMGGWPTTAFLLPDGRIMGGGTFIPPQTMTHKLREVDALYREQRDVVTMRVASMAAEIGFERSEAEVGTGVADGSIIESLAEVLRHTFDPTHGGFGAEPKFPYFDAVRLAFLWYRKAGDLQMLDMARKTLDGMMGIWDDVWGGFYRYSVTADWSQPHYEKMLYVQAGMMDNYLEGFQVTGDRKYAEVASGIKGYITRFLSDQQNGGFYGSQDADVGSHNPDDVFVYGEEYFPRSEEERLAIGLPYTDTTVYTDGNGLMASAYLRLYQVTGDEDARDFALKTLDRILPECMSEGRMYHYCEGERKVPGLLSDQVHFSQALLDAYQSTGVREYLTRAEEIAGFMADELQDVLDGGFYSRPFEPHDRGELLERVKPSDENVAAVKLLTCLDYLTGHQPYRDLAERALTAVAWPRFLKSVMGAGYAIALDRFLSSPLRIVVVGDRRSSHTRQMLEAGLHAYEPSKIVQILDPAEGPLTIGDMTYEGGKDPLAYVCVRNVCREPVADGESLAQVLASVIGNNSDGGG